MLWGLSRHHRQLHQCYRNLLFAKQPHNNNNNASFDASSCTASTTCSRMLVLVASIVSGGAAGIAFLVTATGNTEHTKSMLFISSTLRPRMALCHGAPSSSSHPPCKSRRERLSEYLSSFTKTSEQDSNDRDLTLLLPEYTSAQVAEHGSSGGRVWMSYGGFVYDVTDFIPLHPGGTERISRAAGAAMEPFWYLHQQRFETEQPMQILQTLVVGRLVQADQDKIDEQLQELQNEMNRFRLELDFGNSNSNAASASASVNYTTRILSLHDLKSLPKTDLISKLGCPQSNRPTQTSLFGGVLLKDLLVGVGQEEESSSSSSSSPANVQVHSLVFHAMDGETVTVQMMTTDNNNNSYHDILIAYEENGAPLTHQRGFPLRVIIPSAARQRVVKWVKRIEVRLTPKG